MAKEPNADSEGGQGTESEDDPGSALIEAIREAVENHQNQDTDEQEEGEGENGPVEYEREEAFTHGITATDITEKSVHWPSPKPHGGRFGGYQKGTAFRK